MKIIPLFRLIFFSITSLVIFYILEYGFVFDSSEKLIKPFSLALLATIMFFKPNSKRYVLFLIWVCLALMFLMYLLNLIKLSNQIGDFGFSLLVVTIVLYLPQMIKKGHVEKF